MSKGRAKTGSWAKELWAKSTHQWTWLDTFVGWVAGVWCGVLGLLLYQWYVKGAPPAAMIAVMIPTVRPVLLFLGMMIMFSRAWAIAKYPRQQKIDFTKLTFFGGFWAYHVSAGAVLLAIIFAFGLAPSAAEVFKALARIGGG